MATEKFNVQKVRNGMNIIENHFAAFQETMKSINSFIETNVNASLGSSAYGDLGSKLLTTWNNNASTFQDFYDNFDNWSQVVAIIAANNNQFAVDAKATYRDDAGTLAGVKEARAFVAKSNGLSNVASTNGFSTLGSDARSILDNAFRMKTEKITNNNIYEGKTVSYTDAAGNKIEKYYDGEGNYIGRKITDAKGTITYYDSKGNKVDKLMTAEEYQEMKKKKLEELEKNQKNYLEHLDKLKYGSYKQYKFTASNGLTITYDLYLPDYGQEVDGLPTMMYMHGGGANNSISSLNSHGLSMYVDKKKITPEGIVIIPFIKNFTDRRNLQALKELTDSVVKNNHGDPNKISVSGHSYGAITTYRLINKYPNYYAAAIPISGWDKVNEGVVGTKVWAFHGAKDAPHGNCSASGQKSVVKQIQSYGGTATIHIYENRGHGYTQDDTYSGATYVSPDGTTVTPLEWAFRQSRENT